MSNIQIQFVCFLYLMGVLWLIYSGVIAQYAKTLFIQILTLLVFLLGFTHIGFAIYIADKLITK